MSAAGLRELLGVRPGVTSVIGSGGKTTLLVALAAELPGTVALTTTTHVLPFDGVPLLVSPTPGDVARELGRSRVVCVGSWAAAGGHGGPQAAGGVPPATSGEHAAPGSRATPAKLAAPECGVEALADVADYVLVEADGSRRLPLKAHAAWEPVVPACSGRTVLVVGASGLGRPVREAVHRPEVFCELAGCAPDDPATAQRVARAINAEALADVALVNQADAPGALGAARELGVLLAVPTLVGSLRTGEVTAT